MEQHITCLFCEGVFDEENEGVSTECGHVFHCKCLDKWLVNSNACPQCNKYVEKADNVKLNFKLFYSFPSVDYKIEKLKQRLKKQKENNEVKDRRIMKLRMSVSRTEWKRCEKEQNLRRLKRRVGVVRASKLFVPGLKAETVKLSEEIKQLQQDIKHLKKVNRAKNKRSKRKKDSKMATKKLLLERTISAEEDQREKDSVSEVDSSGQSCSTGRRIKKLKLPKE